MKEMGTDSRYHPRVASPRGIKTCTLWLPPNKGHVWPYIKVTYTHVGLENGFVFALVSFLESQT